MLAIIILYPASPSGLVITFIKNAPKGDVTGQVHEPIFNADKPTVDRTLLWQRYVTQENF